MSNSKVTEDTPVVDDTSVQRNSSSPRKSLEKHVTVDESTLDESERGSSTHSRPRDKRVAQLRRMRSGSQYSEGSFDGSSTYDTGMIVDSQARQTGGRYCFSIFI